MVLYSNVSTLWLEEAVPVVLVSGDWLNQFGFEVGRKVVAEVVKGQIIIKLLEED